MSIITVDENQLEEIVSKVVQQHLKLTFQDMDEVRKSPAGAIVRVETKIEALADAVEELKAEIVHIRTESKEESGKLRVEITNSRAESKEESEKLREEITNSRAESKDESGKLRVEIANSRAETKVELEKHRAETKAELEKHRAETKAELEKHRAETKAEFEKINERLKKLEDGQNKLEVRFAKVESTLKLMVALFFATFGIFASLLAKLIFFP